MDFKLLRTLNEIIEGKKERRKEGKRERGKEGKKESFKGKANS